MPSLEPGGAVAAAGPKPDVAIPGAKPKRKKHQFRAIDLGPETMGAVGQHLGALHGSDIGNDEISDDEARRRAGMGDDFADVGAEPTPPNIENLPAVISKEISETGGKFFPEWQQIKHLPGYIQQPIRAVGRQVFGQFTDVPIEDIQVITTLGGINPEQDVKGMMAWIMKNGVRDHNAKIDFNRIMPGYSADYSLWKTAEYSFLVVKDFGGIYIYGFTGGRGVHLGANPERKRLR